MNRLDTRGRIMEGDPLFGPVCECGNLKGVQARMCWRCWVDELRDDAYWQRRTCECGGPKTPRKQRCRRCANERMRGISTPGRAQPESHPWRAAA